MTLRDRCKAMHEQMVRNGILRQGSPVDDLIEFVVSEIGRSADTKLENTLPLCLYFASEQDRKEFIAIVREAKPNMRMKVVP